VQSENSDPGHSKVRWASAQPVRVTGEDIPAIDLSDTVAGHPGVGVAARDIGTVLDKQALSAYRRRLAEIDADLDEVRSWADTSRAARLAAERGALRDCCRPPQIAA
jgi:hypothetical protein